jgi:hypothetical protein
MVRNGVQSFTSLNAVDADDQELFEAGSFDEPYLGT